MKKAKIILSMAMSALLLAPTAVPTAMCAAAPTGHPKTTRGRRTPQRLPGLVLSNGQRLGPNYLVFHNATYRIIERLDEDMTHDEWSATMRQVLNRVWNLNQVRYRYAQLGNEEMVENLQEEIWDILFYLLDHLTFRCHTGYRLNFDDMIMVFYYVSGGDVTEAGRGDDEQYIAQGRSMDDNLMRWARRRPNERTYRFALNALNALWYNTQLHHDDWGTHVSGNLIRTLRYSGGLRQVVINACLSQLVTRYGRAQYIDGDDYAEYLMSRISPGESIDETIRGRNLEDHAFWNGLLGTQQG